MQISHKENLPSHYYVIAAAALMVALVTFLVFLPSLQNEFLIWDDDKLVVENIYIHSLSLDTVKWSFLNPGLSTWHPATFLSFAIDHAIWGLDPWGFHLTNNMLHALNALLVFLLIFMLVDHAAPEKHGAGLNRAAFIAAIITALLFGLHPMRVESVAWISARKDVLYSFFYLLSILAYFRYAASSTRKGSFYIVSILLFIISLMSKPAAVTLPAVLLVLDYYPLKRISLKTEWNGMRPVIVEKIPFFILSGLTSIVALRIHNPAVDAEIMSGFTFLQRIYLPVRGYIFFLYKMLLPYDLTPIYLVSDGADISLLMLALVLLSFIGITVSCIFLLRRSRVYMSAWLFYIITLLPVIGILRVAGNNPRYIYLACIGPMLLAGLFAERVIRRTSAKGIKALLVIPLISIMAIYANMTVKHIRIWKDTITLWSYQIEMYPDRIPKAYTNRGIAYYRDGKVQLALADYRKAMEIDPEYVKAYNNRGIAYAGMERYREAIEDYTRAIELDPVFMQAYNNRGNTLNYVGDLEAGMMDYNRAIKIDPGHASVYYNRAMLYINLGNKREAYNDLEKASSLGLKKADEQLKRFRFKKDSSSDRTSEKLTAK